MPELPDLQVFSSNLDKALSDKELKDVIVINNKKLNVSVKDLKETLVSQKLKKVYREGKELHFEFSKGDVLALHLMLHGQLFLFKSKHEYKHAIIELLFKDDEGLVLTDFQGAATPTLNPASKDAPDALSKEVNQDFLKAALEKKRTNIKTVLLDQHIIRGIGNAYADEILWDARISPLSAANKIPEEKIKVLLKSIKTVLEHAEREIIKSNPDIISGEIRDFLKVHNPKHKNSPTGGEIITTQINSRKTYYTNEQELFD